MARFLVRATRGRDVRARRSRDRLWGRLARGQDIAHGSERQEWWDRAEWALTLARSDKYVDRIIGLEALTALSSEATRTEYRLILAVTEAVSGEGV